MKSVAIIGAGPAGLVAAKTLLQNDEPAAFDVRVFEKAEHVGGLWRLDKQGSGHDGYLSAFTPTNLSKYTVAFSDLSWESVKAEVIGDGTEECQSKVPMFPKAWMVGRYLAAYATKFDLYQHIELQTEITSVQPLAPGEKWAVETCTPGGRADSRMFDYVIVATGFFSAPKILKDKLRPNNFKKKAKVLHSSQYRDLTDVLPGTKTSQGKILVIGGGNSSGEVAGTIAHHLSSSWHSPSSVHGSNVEDIKVYHVTPRPLYALPPFVPVGDNRPGFAPLDTRLYELSKRPPGPITSNAGEISQPSSINMIHKYIQSLVGGDQSELRSPALVGSEKAQDSTPYVALSENYAEFVRSGNIVVKPGRVSQVSDSGDQDGTLEARFYGNGDDGKEEILDHIVSVVHASGYTAAKALAFLQNDILSELEYDPESNRVPLILNDLQTLNTRFPSLGFIGFYEGPYWGVMEMQARTLAKRWTSFNQHTNVVDRPSERAETMRALRKAMSESSKGVPQYWLGDYLGYMEETARALKLKRNDKPFTDREGPVSPSRYLYDSDDAEAIRTMRGLRQTMETASAGAFVARAAFRALQGKWTMHRRIESVAPGYPSGTFEGVAWFHPRDPTSQEADDSAPYDLEYLYIETGVFLTDSGMSMQGSRRYAYRYREMDDKVSVWFIKPDKEARTVDYLFHELAFKNIEIVQNGLSRQHAMAEGDHLCDKDMYTTRYEFEFGGISLVNWRLRHTVKGPEKNYVSDTRYERE